MKMFNPELLVKFEECQEDISDLVNKLGKAKYLTGAVRCEIDVYELENNSKKLEELERLEHESEQLQDAIVERLLLLKSDIYKELEK
ncbi:hypothetical protein BegalDRAFT_1458 [Beggiatoa alba B18LD]|uniref:Uncharacterized protein n=1 Tax=Beggiatoa alba B18LD TaxID=395493 RepID=I3CFF3_9GAMM|nr:hypothetical protein [Beggiatoa alba]EIJ42346.1 hypothetical protein BegalDRAFT_1458 [Beggiatoa alba B18LD]